MRNFKLFALSAILALTSISCFSQEIVDQQKEDAQFVAAGKAAGVEVVIDDGKHIWDAAEDGTPIEETRRNYVFGTHPLVAGVTYKTHEEFLAKFKDPKFGSMLTTRFTEVLIQSFGFDKNCLTKVDPAKIVSSITTTTSARYYMGNAGGQKAGHPGHWFIYTGPPMVVERIEIADIARCSKGSPFHDVLNLDIAAPCFNILPIWNPSVPEVPNTPQTAENNPPQQEGPPQVGPPQNYDGPVPPQQYEIPAQQYEAESGFIAVFGYTGGGYTNGRGGRGNSYRQVTNINNTTVYGTCSGNGSSNCSGNGSNNNNGSCRNGSCNNGGQSPTRPTRPTQPTPVGCGTCENKGIGGTGGTGSSPAPVGNPTGGGNQSGRFARTGLGNANVAGLGQGQQQSSVARPNAFTSSYARNMSAAPTASYGQQGQQRTSATNGGYYGNRSAYNGGGYSGGSQAAPRGSYGGGNYAGNYGGGMRSSASFSGGGMRGGGFSGGGMRSSGQGGRH